MSVPRCHRVRCGARLTERPGPFGALDFVCLPCERNAAGLCRLCPNPTVRTSPKAHTFYCVSCRAERERRQDRERYWHHGKREGDIERQRQRRENPLIYADMIDKQRARHRKTKRDDLDRLYHRTYTKSRRAGTPRVTVDRRQQRTSA